MEVKPRFWDQENVSLSLEYYGSTKVWIPRVKIKSFGWAANHNQPQHQLKFVVTITQYYNLHKKTLGKNDLIKVS